MTVDARVYGILAEAGFSDALFNPRQHRTCELVEQYVLHLAIDLVGRLGVTELLVPATTVDDLLGARGFVPAFGRPLRWLLDRLVLAGLAVQDEAGRYTMPAPLPPADLATLRATALDLDSSYAPTFALLDEAAALYPRVARGEVTGEQALFRKTALWFAYFDNANGYYALTNRVAAQAAAACLAPGASVLEVGAGLGSATEALLERLGGATGLHGLASYQATEPVALFRRRAERTLAAAYPTAPLAFSPLDINEGWVGQGVAPESVQLVWGVNVFHLARLLPAVLHEAREALAPGGWLVIGEGLRPSPGQPVGAEFPFQILDGFTNVALDPVTRSTPGFLTAEEWLAALDGAGFVALRLVPDAMRLRALYPGFLAVAICGQRPPLAPDTRSLRASR